MRDTVCGQSLALRTLAGSGDEIAVMLPNYMQIWGIAQNHGLAVGGYGEFYFEDTIDGNNTADMYRFITYIGYKFSDRIVMSPFAAKRLTLLLNNVVAEFEKKFGKIDIGVQAPSGSTVQ